MRITHISLRDGSGFFLDQTGDFTSALNGVIHFVSGERGTSGGSTIAAEGSRLKLVLLGISDDCFASPMFGAP